MVDLVRLVDMDWERLSVERVRLRLLGGGASCWRKSVRLGGVGWERLVGVGRVILWELSGVSGEEEVASEVSGESVGGRGRKRSGVVMTYERRWLLGSGCESGRRRGFSSFQRRSSESPSS